MRRANLTPSHMGNHIGLQPCHGPGPLGEPRGANVIAQPRSVLGGGLEHHLHAHADAEHGPAPGQPAFNESRSVDGPQLVHDGAESPDTGNHEPVGGLDSGPVGGQLDGGSHPFQGAHSGMNVAAAVGQDDDAGLVHALTIPGNGPRAALVSQVDSSESPDPAIALPHR